jgi:hypothetical protein
MTDIPLGRADYHRTVPKEARVQTRNRYFEQNPVLSEKLTALIARPAMKRWLPVGEGPIRNRVYSSPGNFDEALFVVSGNSWFRVETNGDTTNLTNAINPGGGGVSMAATGTIGETPEFLFMADGRNLWLYLSNGYARGTLQGVPANNDTFKVGGTYYKWTSASVDAGTPAGTLADPWLVDLGTDALEAFTNAGAAIGATGEPGVDYSTALTAQGQVQVAIVSDDTLAIRANTPGVIGNGIATTETGAAIAWGAVTLTGGGTDSVSVVQTPDDVGVISVGYIAGYVVVVPAQGEGINGGFGGSSPAKRRSTR